MRRRNFRCSCGGIGLNEQRTPATPSHALCDRLERIVQEISNVAEAERDAFERRPISSQHSEAGYNSDEAAAKIDDLANTISNAAAELREIPEDHNSKFAMESENGRAAANLPRCWF